MIEEIDTNSKFSNKDIPDGKNTFRVMSVKKNEKLYIFTLSYDNGKEGEQVFFSSTIAPLLKALGCKESKPGVYILDTDVILGTSFVATVSREADKKDPTKIYQRMKDFGEVPF